MLLREALTRLSTERMGWLWILIEPMAHTAFIMVVYTFIRHRLTPGYEFPVFLAIGVSAFKLFSNTTQRPIEAIKANTALFSYRQVLPVDTVLVRAFLEGVIQFIVAVILLALANLLGFHVLPYDPLAVLKYVFLVWILGSGLGLIFSVGAQLIPEIGKIVHVAFIPMYLMSGVVFSIHAMPDYLARYVLINPLVHGIELLRVAFFSTYEKSPLVSEVYLTLFALIAFFLGLALQVKFRRRMIEL